MSVRACVVGSCIVGAVLVAQTLPAQTTDVVELVFDASFSAFAGHPHATNSWPQWLVQVDQQDGQFSATPPAWQADATAAVGRGRLIVSLDRSLLHEDVAVALLYEGDPHTDVALQLFDDEGRVVVLDVFGNLLQVGQEAHTDTFVVPLREHPSATKIVVRRITGAVRLSGMVIYPVVGKADADEQTLAALAKLLGDPLSPENSLAKRVTAIAKHQGVTVSLPSVPTGALAAAAAKVAPVPGLLPPGLPTQGLVAHWGFAGGAATDGSGQGHHGLKHGPLTAVAGIRGEALDFNGNQGWVEVPHSPQFDLRTALTVSAWIKYRSIEGGFGSEIIWYGDEQAAHDPYAIHLMSGGVYQFRIDTEGGGQCLVADAPDRLQPGRWYHVASTMESQPGKLKVLRSYVDGQLIHVETVEGNIDYDTSRMWIAIGAVDKGWWQNFHGAIDEVSLYDRALSKSEIRAMYDQLRLPTKTQP